jgi:hypothetical protein
MKRSGAKEATAHRDNSQIPEDGAEGEGEGEGAKANVEDKTLPTWKWVDLMRI